MNISRPEPKGDHGGFTTVVAQLSYLRADMAEPTLAPRTMLQPAEGLEG
ncbi:MAG: hypothetical protein R2867_35085 [Caldilineaceae bacterium]